MKQKTKTKRKCHASVPLCVGKYMNIMILLLELEGVLGFAHISISPYYQ
jgi:hypothetical protein